MTAKSVIQSTDQSPTVVRCLVVGGFPPPTITVAFDRRDVSAHFRFRSRANVTGSRGLRLIEYRSERRTSDWRPTRADNGRRVRCVASVPGLASSSTDARLNILCELYCIYTLTIAANGYLLLDALRMNIRLLVVKNSRGGSGRPEGRV